MKRLLILAVICGGQAILPVQAHAAIEPVVTCWTDSTGTDLVTIRFGYSNTDAGAVTIPIGIDNFLSVASSAPPQPVTFEPGTHADAFLVTVPAAEASSVEWTVDGTTAAVNLATDPECSSCFCPAGPEGAGGATGPTGPVGPTGPAGPQGVAGIDGEKGPVGDAGPIGATGAAGPIGVTGEAGPTGPAGIAGVEGIRGEAGPRGPRGIDGVQGAPGPAGAIGATGPVGVIGAAGATGVEGAQGAVGPDGKGSIVRSPRQLFVTGVIAARSSEGGSVSITVGGQTAGIDYRVPATGQWILIPVSVAAPATAGRAIEVIGTEGVEVGERSLSVVGLSTPLPGRRRAVGR